MELKPRPYQEDGRDFLAARPLALLADEMRVGKTPQAILAADKVGARRVLVVCPAIAVQQWCAEWRRWSPGRPGARAYSGGEVGADCLLCVTSYNRLVNGLTEFTLHPWDLVIVDESHYVKSADAQRTAAVFGAAGVARASRRVWCLSGTPAANDAGELYVMLKCFGIWQGTWNEYKYRYCDVDNMGEIRGTKESRIPELKELLAKCMLRRKRKDVAPELPDLEYNFLELEGAPPDVRLLFMGNPMFQSQLGDQLERLAALVEGDFNAKGDDWKDVRMYCAAAKAQPLVNQIVAAIGDGVLTQTVVFGVHKIPLELVRGGLVDAGIKARPINGWTSDKDRQKIISDFQLGRCQVIVANVQAAGTAIDLSAADHGYFLELDWVPANNIQAASRVVSLQKQSKVSFDVCTWAGSVDVAVQKALTRKVRQLSALL